MTTLENNASTCNLEFCKAVLQDLRKCEKTHFYDFIKNHFRPLFFIPTVQKGRVNPHTGQVIPVAEGYPSRDELYCDRCGGNRPFKTVERKRVRCMLICEWAFQLISTKIKII